MSRRRKSYTQKALAAKIKSLKTPWYESTGAFAVVGTFAYD